jgi:hypothetical protein
VIATGTHLSVAEQVGVVGEEVKGSVQGALVHTRILRRQVGNDFCRYKKQGMREGRQRSFETHRYVTSGIDGSGLITSDKLQQGA